MTKLVFSQNKPSKIKLTELLLTRDFFLSVVLFVVFFFFIFFDEEFINRWGVTAVLRTTLIAIGLLLLIPSLIILWAKSGQVQNRRPPTLHIEDDRVVFHGYKGSQLVKFDAIKRVTVHRKPGGDIASITLHQRPFQALACQNFDDMPALYATLKERLPASVSWFEPKSSGRWFVKPYQFVFFLLLIGLLFSSALNLAFSSALTLGLMLLLGIQGTSQILQQSRKASRGAKVTLVLGATTILGFYLYALGDIPQALYHPCGLVHRWQSGCLKAYPDGENLLFLPDGKLARLSSKSIVIEPLDGTRFINLFRATRLLNDRYASNLSFSADGHTAVAGNRGSGILIWDVPTQSVTMQNIPNTSDMVLSPDGKLLGPGGGPIGTIIVLDTDTWQPAFTLETEGHGETALGSTLLAVDLDQAVHFYDVQSGEETAVFSIDWTERDDFIQVMAFSEDEQLLTLVPSQDVMAVLRRDGAVWQELHRVQLPPSSRTDVVAFSDDNSLLAVYQINYDEPDGRSKVFIFSLADMELLQTLDLGTGRNYYDIGNVNVMDFSPDNTMLAISNYSEGAVFELALAK